jgi:fibronectin type 3 domain-containing protein
MTIQGCCQSRRSKLIAGLLITAQLVACGGGGSGDETPSTTSTVSPSSVTIAWTAPVARADGSPLSLAEIAGYRIYYGTSEGDYPDRIDVSDSTAVEAVISDLSAGSYYFVVTTYDTAGRESGFSPVVTVSI